MFLGIPLRFRQKVTTRVHISKGHETEAIGGMELLFQKVAACVSDFSELEEVGCWEKRLHNVFADFHHTRVDKLDEEFNG